MTQPVNDPWAAASATPQTQAPVSTREHSTASAYGQPDTASSLAGSYAPEPPKQSSLFGPTIETLPSLFTLQHAPGTEIKGEILSEPRDVHSTCHPTQSPDKKSRLKQYWVTDPTTQKRVPGLAPIDVQTGKPNDPVMNLVISLQTGERDPQIEGDDGRRSWFVQGSAKPPKGHVLGAPTSSARLALLDAIKLAAQSGVRIASDQDFIKCAEGCTEQHTHRARGLFISVRRIEREQPGVQTSPWKWQARITKD